MFLILRLPRTQALLNQVFVGHKFTLKLSKALRKQSKLIMSFFLVLIQVWLFLSIASYNFENENEDLIWGCFPGTQRYKSLASTMYYSLVTMQSEVPQGDTIADISHFSFSPVFFVLTGMCGTFVFMFPSAVLASAFASTEDELEEEGIRGCE